MNFPRVSMADGMWDIVWTRKVRTGADARQAGLYGAVFTLEAGEHLISSRTAVIEDCGGKPFSDALGQGDERSFSLKWSGSYIQARIIFKTYHGGDIVTTRAELTNAGAKAVKLGRLSFPSVDRAVANSTDYCPMLELGSGVSSAKVFVESGCLEAEGAGVLDIDAESVQWAFRLGAVPPAGPSDHEGIRRHSSYGMGVVHNPSENLACIAGALTFERVNPSVVTLYNQKSKEILFFGTVSNFAGFSLPPGKVISTETFMFEFTDAPLTALEKYGKAVKKVNNIDIKQKIHIGWVDLKWWYYPAVKDPASCERRLLDNVAFMDRRFKDYAAEYIWVSNSNLKNGLPDFPEDANKYHPSGLKWLNRKLAESGMKLGFWTPPFWIAAGNKLSKTPGLTIQDDGFSTRHGFHPDSIYRPEDERPLLLTMDTTHPTAQAVIRERFATLTGMGAKFHMLDFMFDLREYCDYHDKNVVPGLEAHRIGLRIVRETVGDDVHLLSAIGPTIAGVGIVTASRIGEDYGEAMTSQCTNWKKHQTVLSRMSACFYTHMNFYINNSGDVLFVDEPCPLATAQFSVGMFALSGGPIMIGDDLPTLSAERIALIEKCLPSYGKIARPLDLFENTKPDGYPTTLHLHVETAWDSWEVVGLANCGPEEAKRTVRLSELGIEEDSPVNVFDFWKESSLGVHRDCIEVTVGRRSMTILRIRRNDKAHPWILATSMHVIQGADDLKNVKWNAKRRELSGVASRTKGAAGRIFVTVPEGFGIKEVIGNGAALGRIEKGVAALELSFDRKELSWRILFE